MKPFFAFDLDSTITKCELLPMIAQAAGLGGEMARLTERAMQGSVPFEEDFRARVALLKHVPVSQARAIAADMPLNMEIAGFIRAHAQRCAILTGNLDVWIAPIIERLGMQGRCLCSKASVCGDRLLGVASVLNKESACRGLPRPFVAIGDGSNDVGMLRAADTGIAFCGVRMPPRALVEAADICIEDERELAAYLYRLAQG